MVGAPAQMSATQVKHRLLFFSLEDWDDVWRRNQFICSELISRYPDSQILWVSPPYDFSHAPTRIDPRVLRLSVHPEFAQISIFKPLKLLPNVIGRSINSTLMQIQLESVVRKLGWNDFDIWINDQKARHYLPRGGAKKLIYDVTDDWTQFEQPPRIMKAVLEDDAWCLAHSNDVIVCSDWLYKKNKAASPQNVHLIPNGVDSVRYHPDQVATRELPVEFAGATNNVVGYTGTLHEERLDLDLIAKTALILPEISFFFVGPNALQPEQTAALQKLPNVHILGPRSYAQLPAYIKGFDICMTPHKVSAFTESLDPLKLYEYMATGKPIVATPCAGFRDLPHLVHIAATPELFADAIVRCLKEKTPSSQQRIDWSSQHTWQKRVDDVSNVLNWR